MALVELARFSSSIAAEIACGFIESHGVGAVTFDGGMNIADSAAFAIPVRLMVLDEDYEAANILLVDSGLT